MTRITRFNAARLPDWPERLAAYLAAGAALPFAWGQRDCVLAAMGGIASMTGTHPAPWLPGAYSDAAGAAAEMAALADSRSLLDAARNFAGAAGFALINKWHAQRGDAVLAIAATPDGGRAPAIGLIDLGGRHGVFAAPLGWQRLPVSLCLYGWRVP